MFRIMLCCSAGMSTSMLVRKMVEEAETRGLPVKIDAYGVAEFDTQFPNYQVVLLGPRVKYMLTTLRKGCHPWCTRKSHRYDGLRYATR